MPWALGEDPDQQGHRVPSSTATLLGLEPSQLHSLLHQPRDSGRDGNSPDSQPLGTDGTRGGPERQGGRGSTQGRACDFTGWSWEGRRQSSQHPYEIGSTVTPVSQRRRPRLREVIFLAQAQTASGQSQN